MTQPDYVPVSAADRVRPSERLPAPRKWRADRPGELTDLVAPTGRRFGVPGPDQGFGKKLARTFVSRLRMQKGENPADIVAGALAIGLKRAALFGRAPVATDFELAFTLWGYLDDHAPDDLVEMRCHVFQSAAHHYWDQRDLADWVPESTLRMTPAQVREQLPSWRSLITGGEH